MTDSEQWKPIPGYPFYEASDQGQIRSVDREVNGRQMRGTILKPRVGNRGYLLVNLRKDTRTVHTAVLEAWRGTCPPGMVARHLNDDPLDNRIANLEWGTPEQNEHDKFRNGSRQPAAPPEPKTCIRCGGAFTTPGRRCHLCLADLGEQAAPLLASGVALDEVCKRLDYPSETGLLRLAVRHGGLRLVLATPPLPSQTVTPAARARVTLRDRIRGWRR